MSLVTREHRVHEAGNEKDQRVKEDQILNGTGPTGIDQVLVPLELALVHGLTQRNPGMRDVTNLEETPACAAGMDPGAILEVGRMTNEEDQKTYPVGQMTHAVDPTVHEEDQMTPEDGQMSQGMTDLDLRTPGIDLRILGIVQMRVGVDQTTLGVDLMTPGPDPMTPGQDLKEAGRMSTEAG